MLQNIGLTSIPHWYIPRRSAVCICIDMTTRLKKNYPTLRLLHKAKPKLVKAVINNSPPDFIHCLADCCHNLLKGHIRITKHQKKDLSRIKELFES